MVAVALLVVVVVLIQLVVVVLVVIVVVVVVQRLDESADCVRYYIKYRRLFKTATAAAGVN